MKNYLEAYKTMFNVKEEGKLYYSPGRVNLIGEHIDYNGGLVFPSAISIGTYGVAGKRSDCFLMLYSDNYPHEGIIMVDLNQLQFDKSHGWANYAKGIFHEMKNRGYDIPFGINLYIKGNLPTASGLSSSASLEVLVAFIANDFYQFGLSRTDMAILAQHVENNYMGMHCGIMDQLIIAEGIKNHAILMNTATLEMTPSKATFDDYQLVIMNTNYKRKTTDSKYNERVRECQEALNILKNKYDIDYLCDLKPYQLNEIETFLNHHILFKRVRHAVTEQQRTLDAMDAMKNADLLTFGKLLDESHQSLKNDYEVTGLHLDTLVDAAKQSGAIGARVTGAGFGGCAIALVKNDFISRLEHEVQVTYYTKTGIMPEFYLVEFTDGVKKII